MFWFDIKQIFAYNIKRIRKRMGLTQEEFAEKIKSYDMTSVIPVILISSLNSDEYKNKAKQCGTDMFISKHDFNQEYFLRSVQYLIKKRKRNSNV